MSDEDVRVKASKIVIAVVSLIRRSTYASFSQSRRFSRYKERSGLVQTLSHKSILINIKELRKYVHFHCRTLTTSYTNITHYHLSLISHCSFLRGAHYVHCTSLELYHHIYPIYPLFFSVCMREKESL
jgi:hypothetical protein